ncbi:hypothetical protein [Planktothrix agardhii]|jgi:hypothetical protein|uniref:Uncharacterized protein n=1 Tax=Planktothrix agardhii TaxID=1160 RepID=A0AAD1V6A6_PLAAG|nr:hypothetical protein [Planktothrix agardhii]BBD57057.1 hypothetical protein NIES204_43930 [Planktothrix agardhii NIES-204]CAD5983192.1 hypothetical protein NO2A_04326 [Planktothrix agardhii]CAD5983233.1 hypothetical protein PANO66_04341 [Planktothrix agardhii]
MSGLVVNGKNRLMNQWEKWVKGSWGDRIKVLGDESLESFSHCLSVLWYGQADRQRLAKLDYSLKPDEQNKKDKQPDRVYT